jgi:protein gp37
MNGNTKIEWTDSTWNPVRGCDKISPGCTHCYAETFAERFRGTRGHPFEQGFDLQLVPTKLAEPLCLPRRQVIFVNSMSDLFHDQVPDDYIERVARVMMASPWHTYQVLTKRSARLRDLLRGQLAFAAQVPHIWWGVSVEDQRHGLPRINDLKASGAAMKFLSVEPLLEDLGAVEFGGLDWVIVGGESGPRARPMPAEWVRPIRDHCQARQIPFFFKQWGGVRKHLTGRLLDGRTWDERPPLPQVDLPSLQHRRAITARLIAAGILQP